MFSMFTPAKIHIHLKQVTMKKLSVLILFTGILFFSSTAQTNLRPFKVDLGIGYAIPAGKGVKGGVLLVIEPKYAVIPQLALGLRFEGAIIARFTGYDAEGNPNTVDVKGQGSYVATGDYYFTNNYAVRPFVGGGIGIYRIAGVEVTSGTEGVSASSKFGGMLRAGVELSHVRLGMEYNIVPSTTFSGYDMNGSPATLTSKNSYLGLKLGVCIGGGKK
jgi:opacity protein-like surface antigen